MPHELRYNQSERCPALLRLMSFKAKPIRLFIIVLSLFVFLLTLNAKLSLYDQPSHVNTVNSSKLWLNGQKLEPPPATLVLAVLAVAIVVFRLRFSRHPWQTIEIPHARPSRLLAFRAHRFLRPPPFCA
jgi:hypothetical protein